MPEPPLCLTCMNNYIRELLCSKTIKELAQGIIDFNLLLCMQYKRNSVTVFLRGSIYRNLFVGKHDINERFVHNFNVSDNCRHVRFMEESVLSGM